MVSSNCATLLYSSKVPSFGSVSIFSSGLVSCKRVFALLKNSAFLLSEKPAALAKVCKLGRLLTREFVFKLPSLSNAVDSSNLSVVFIVPRTGSVCVISMYLTITPSAVILNFSAVDILLRNSGFILFSTNVLNTLLLRNVFSKSL